MSKKNKKKDIIWRARISFLLVILLAVLVLGKIFTIQIKEGEVWNKIADSITTKTLKIQGARGNIYTEDGDILAVSLPAYDIYLDLNTQPLNDSIFFANVDSLSFLLGNYFKDKTPKEYKTDLLKVRKSGSRFHLLKKDLTTHQKEHIAKFPIFRLGKIKGGFITNRKNKRIQPYGNLAKRTIGYISEKDSIVGLEGAFNEYLKGKKEEISVKIIAGGRKIPVDKTNIEPAQGNDIISTLNINMQDITDEELQKGLSYHNADGGCAVLMEVKTGKIKAISNLTRGSDSSQYSEKFNYAIAQSIAPGSTFKLVSAIILMEKANVKLNDTVDAGKGFYKFYDQEMRDTRLGGYGKISFLKAFSHSSNIAFSKLVFDKFKHNPKKFLKAIKQLNLDKKLGIPIAGEIKPFFLEPGQRNWSGTTLPWMAIGYESKISPIQMLTFYNGVANGGRMVKPLFVTSIKEYDKEIQKFDTKVINERMFNDLTLFQLRKMLVSVVDTGTAKNIKNYKYKIAGKTGTAIMTVKGRYTKNKQYYASFIGYFPANNPKYSLIISVYNPRKNGYYGGQVAAPIFRRIADNIMAMQFEKYQKDRDVLDYSNIPLAKYSYSKDMSIILSELGLKYSQEITQSNILVKNMNTIKKLNMRPIYVSDRMIPDLSGMLLDDAIFLTENMGLKIKVRGYGKIRKQSLKPGTPFKPNDTITVLLY